LNQKLNLYATFRSHDLFKAALPNAYALCHMLKNYATTLNLVAGHIEITSISAHLYLSDLYNVELFIKCINVTYTPPIHWDPRGYCVITKIDDRFSFELIDNNTHIVKIKIVDTGYNLFHKIIQDKLIVNLEHLAYIHEQLKS